VPTALTGTSALHASTLDGDAVDVLVARCLSMLCEPRSGAVTHAEFEQHTRHVVLERAFREVEPPGDRSVRPACCGEAQHVDPSRAETLDCCHRIATPIETLLGHCVEDSLGQRRH
jgi:hypothetical protein